MTRGLLEATLALASNGTATNFYHDDSDIGSDFDSTAAERRHCLRSHIVKASGGDLVVIGEAAGWRGARQSGVPFTSAPDVGLRGTRESSATIVRSQLAQLGLLDRTLLWNAFPLHPHRLGVYRSNRSPTPQELRTASVALQRAIQGRRIICVGRHSARSIERLTGKPVPTADSNSANVRAVAVRHPSFGGAAEFRTGLSLVAANWVGAEY